MSQSQRNGPETDTIDLTLSSPEPEPWPQSPTREQIRAPPQQSHLSFGPTYNTSRVKQESDHVPRIKSDPGQPSRIQTASTQPSRVVMDFGQSATSSRNLVAPQQARPINPSHIQSIISTVNPYALQTVLVELCQISPAFSGALVRGLAPHSTSARNMINQRRMEIDRNAAYEAVNTISSSGRYGSQVSQRSYTRQHPYSSHSIPRIKREPYRPSTPSSDSELRRPGPSSQKAVRPAAIRTPLHHLAGGSPSSNITSNVATATQRADEVQRVIPNVTKTCTKCHESFSGDSEPCIYHPGRKVKREDGTIVWSCCQEDMLSVGCDFGGTHTTQNHEPEDMPTERKSLSGSSVSNQYPERLLELLGGTSAASRRDFG
ncbi:hypothetical protein COCSADRAFT_314710 [Bipolaris sorokiniana ND90Pr]|uniref:Uncharacterized protein n=1 Tax=Cochliobolus sativus (strain ND90Pr / ATCC 201652) TaxID=665912 RepID=M2SR88_COCSN|nr:uncharacterized protein COCSADRAFT_314710 [Bipolaris sorokiniana ND90Pr]EMD64800.1 hypothetical protein COCSADRAFT_314710 [Bipolaris sorokiniana ND90Pr]